MDPIAGGAVKQIQQNVFQEAEQQIQKANEQVSDFEQLRAKLEQQDAVSNPQQIEAMNRMNMADPTSQVDAASQAQKIGDVKGVEVPEIKNMEELQGVVNNIKEGQNRLNQIINEACSGKTYSPSEMIAMQAEVSKITTELEMATKVVENFVSSIKTTLNIQF